VTDSATGNLAHRRGAYGIDAPYVPLFFGASGAALLVIAAVTHGHGPWPFVAWLGAAWFLFNAASFLYTTRAGKFAVWAEILRELRLGGDERVLDMGCGRGMVLLMVAKLLPRGRAVGVDLWSTADQSGNRADVTRRNADLEGVADRVELHTGDMRDLPFADDSFDVVLSSLAIHNIADAAGRARAVEQAARVLRPGGRLVIADFRATGEYAARLGALGLSDVRVRRLGWRYWYGNPWAATVLVTATRPASGPG
jgi:arsenite methyltransferase